MSELVASPAWGAAVAAAGARLARRDALPRPRAGELALRARRHAHDALSEAGTAAADASRRVASCREGGAPPEAVGPSAP